MFRRDNGQPDPRRRHYTERELRRMAAELRRLKPTSEIVRLFRRKGEQP